MISQDWFEKKTGNWEHSKVFREVMRKLKPKKREKFVQIFEDELKCNELYCNLNLVSLTSNEYLN